MKLKSKSEETSSRCTPSRYVFSRKIWAELFDVLRKRRNRPDASEEDLGLPQSPTTPPRKDHIVNQSEVSSLSLLSMASSDLDDDLTASANFIGGGGDKATYSSFSSGGGRFSSSFDSSRNSDEIDLDISAGSRLSHSAAHHKMAVRPKKKGPTRHRRPKEPTVLPSTPEVNEDVLKLSTPNIKNSFAEKQKIKSHSLPPGVNAKIIEQHSTSTLHETSSISMKRSKTESTSVSSTCVIQSVRVESDQTSSSQTSTLERNREEEGSFFKRFLQRSSKKMKRSTDEGDRAQENLPSISVENYENVTMKIDERKTTSSEESKKEITTEVKSGLSALLNSVMGVSSGERLPPSENVSVHKLSKPKSGPAARQRVQPQDLSAQAPPPPPPEITITELSPSALLIENEKHIPHPVVQGKCLETNKNLENPIEKSSGVSKLSASSTDEYKVTAKTTSVKDESVPSIIQTHEHFEKKDSRAQPRIVGLSPFQQKISRVESSTLDSLKPVAKQRKSVEKSKSFRYYDETENSDSNLRKRENMPSLPDLTSPKATTGTSDAGSLYSRRMESKTVTSMGFEINDNNLIKVRKHDEPVTQPIQGSIFTKNIILSSTKSTSPTCNKNINEIEENIDKLVKSPFITVLKSEELNEVKTFSNVSTTIIRKSETSESNETTEAIQTRLRFTDRVKSASSEILNRFDTKYRSEAFEQKMFGASTESKDRKLTLELIESKSDSKCKESAIATTPTKPRRSSAFFESKTNSEVGDIPEFMKIQLNRVDSNRPKSNLVLSKNAKIPDFEDRGELTRRFSNESVEITDTKPPLPPEASTTIGLSTSGKRSSITSITKSQEDFASQPLKSPVSKKPEESFPKSPVKKVDEENNFLKNAENIGTAPIIETHVTYREGKPKYIKKIEEQKAEKRKSVIDSSREIIDKETGVVLRKKSFSANNQTANNKEDTPELMKVFARRSLKIKDTDETPNFDDSERSSSLKKGGNLDSDKENQSSSEEKLDKLPKIEITIQPKASLPNGQLAMKQDDKVRSDLFRKPNTASLIHTTTPKPFVQPIRYSSVTTYRSISTAFAEKIKDTSASSLITSSSVSSIITPQTATAEESAMDVEQTTTAAENEKNNNSNATFGNDTTTTNIRHTIGTTSPATVKSANQNASSEFKGILQRRAEWEKRAKEALK